MRGPPRPPQCYTTRAGTPALDLNPPKWSSLAPGQPMSIRAKLGVLIVACVTVPLVASALFWIRTLHDTVDDIGWDVILSSPARLDATLAERSQKTAAARSATTAEILEIIGKRLGRDLA